MYCEPCDSDLTLVKFLNNSNLLQIFKEWLDSAFQRFWITLLDLSRQSKWLDSDTRISDMILNTDSRQQSHGLARKTTTVKTSNIKPYTHTHTPLVVIFSETVDIAILVTPSLSLHRGDLLRKWNYRRIFSARSRHYKLGCRTKLKPCSIMHLYHFQPKKWHMNSVFAPMLTPGRESSKAYLLSVESSKLRI